MISASFSYFDMGVIAIMGLSCAFAFFRGFVKEMLSLGAWVGAGIITVYNFPAVAKAIKPFFKSDVVAAGFATLGLYIILLLAFSLFNMMILKMLREGSDIGFLDNSLGLLFGALRGAFIISLGYFIMTMGMTEQEYPEWLKASRTQATVEEGAILLARMAPTYLQELSSLYEKMHRRAGNVEKADKLRARWEERRDKAEALRENDNRTDEEFLNSGEKVQKGQKSELDRLLEQIEEQESLEKAE